MNMRQGPSGPGPRPDTNDDEQMDHNDAHIEGKGDKSNGLDLGALRETCCNTSSVKTTTGKSMGIYC